MDEGEDWLEVNFPIHPRRTPGILGQVYRHTPDGQVVHYERRLSSVEVLMTEPTLPTIRYADIVAVWLKILRRPIG